MPNDESDALLLDPSFGLLKRTLIERTGLFYYQDKDSELAAAISARMRALSISHCASYFALLSSDAGALEFFAIVARLTIGETYFFRHAEQFDALRDTVLPDILRRNRQRESLRIWSAGCANGAEPYSLSILLRRDLAHLTAGWKIEIVGSDINREVLESAEAGIFGDWALRSVSDEIRDQCFRPVGKRWELAPQYREGVSFRQHNLASDILPAIDTPDLILCRNVMIYFNQELIPQLIDRFHDWLVPGGWLIVGHAEANLQQFQRFSVREAPGATLYQTPSGCSCPLEWFPVRAEATTCHLVWNPIDLPQLPAQLPAQLPISCVAPTEPTWCVVERQITEKNWTAANELCDQLLAIDPVDSRGHFLKAIILEANGQLKEQEKALRRSIYLDRGFMAAHYYLASLLERTGDLRGALRSWDTTARLLARLAPDSRPIPLSSMETNTLIAAVSQKLQGGRVA